MRATSLLSIIGSINPAAWDAIIPHGPGVASRLEQVALNPQPLPPHDGLLVGAANMAHAVARLAVEASLRGESTDFVREVIDDWCGTPWPRKWPWPWPGPRPDEGPFPDPWVLDTARVVGAVVFTSVASRLAEGELQSTLLEGAERLADVAVRG